MVTATASQFQRAIDRARAMGGARRVLYRGAGRFTTDGVHGWYTIIVHRDGTLSCSCPAGERQRLCWHLAAVWLWSLGRGGLPYLRSLAPAPAPAPEPAAEPAAEPMLPGTRRFAMFFPED